MPAVEAMTVGVPVIAANRGALPEAVGAAGALVRSRRRRRASPRRWRRCSTTRPPRPDARRRLAACRAVHVGANGAGDARGLAARRRAPKGASWLIAPLHIGIDGRELLGQPTGVGRYLLEVLRAWTSDGDARHRYHGRSSQPSPPDVSRRLGPRVQWVWSSRQRTPARCGNRCGCPARSRARRRRRAVRAGLHGAAAYGAARSSSRSTTCRSSRIRSGSAGAKGCRRRWLTRRAAERAARVRDHLGVLRGGDRAVPRHRARPDRAGAAWRRRRRRCRTRPRPETPVVLFVGSLFNRRHIPDLLRGVRARAHAHVPGARLVLVGDNRTTPPH